MTLAKTYKSKANLIWVSPILSLLILIALLMVGNQRWLNAVFVAGAGFIIAALISDTSYRLSNHELEIKSSILLRKKIDINTITKIKVTSDAFADPAFSQDRLFIFFNQDECLIISPKEKTDFILALKALNPSIEVA